MREFAKKLIYVLMVLALVAIVILAMRPNSSIDGNAGPKFTSKSYWLDSGKAADFKDAINQDYIQFKDSYLGGYYGGNTWFKLDIAPGDSVLKDNEYWTLTVLPVFLDKLEVYDVTDPNALEKMAVIGDSYSGLPGFSPFGLRVAIEPKELPRRLLIKLETSSVSVAEFSIGKSHQIALQEVFYFALFSVVFILHLLILVVTLFLVKMRKTPLMFLMFVKHFVVVIYSLSLFGFIHAVLGRTFDSSSLDKFLQICSVLYGSSLVIYEAYVVSYLFFYKRAKVFFGFVTSAVVGISIYVLMEPPVERMRVFVVMILFILLLLAALIIFMKPAPKKTKDIGFSVVWYRGYFFAFMLSIFFAAGVILNWHLPVQAIWSGAVALVPSAFVGVSMVVQLWLMIERDNLKRQSARYKLKIKNTSFRLEKQAREEKETLLAMLTHELATPLGVMSLNLHKMKSESQSYKRIYRSLLTMQSLIDRYRLANKSGGFLSAMSMQPVWLAGLVNDIVTSCKEPHRVSFVANNVFSATTINADKWLLKTVVTNVLENALSYSLPLTMVSVYMERVEGEVDCWRIGISNFVAEDVSEDTSMWFNKFWRGSGSGVRGGSGLGLYIVKKSVEELGGYVSAVVLSGPRRVQFTLEFPCSK